MEGTESACTACAKVLDGDDFNGMATDYIDDIVDIDDFDGAGADLLMHAWALLVNNRDLVKWAVCWVTGSESKGDCLMSRIEGSGDNVNIRLKAGSTHQFYTPLRGVSLGRIWGGVIQVYEDAKWSEYVAVWDDDAVASDGTPIGRMCAAVDLACTLLHELTHVCWRAFSDSSGDCDSSYLIENAFRWAMFQRYPDALQSGCCGNNDLGSGAVFGSDDAKWLDSDCVQSSSSSDGSAVSAAYKEWWLEHRSDKPGTTFTTERR